eukprot:5969019-Prymnesium_polylepis.1
MAAGRVTLEDFRELQKELLKARQALYDTETKVKAQALELDKHRAVASLFSAATPPAAPPATSAVGVNPFGAAPSREVGVQTPESRALDDHDEELTGASCTPKAAAATSTTPETTSADADARRRAADTAGGAERAALVLQRQRLRALVRVGFHGWCAAHSQTKILRNMSGMAALMRQQPVAAAQERSRAAAEPVTAPASDATSARLARLEEELAAADDEREEAVAAAVAAAQRENEAATAAAVGEASRAAVTREAELAARASA